ncbi:hypothetical protein AVEN_167802-1 [Araneus ventricosus]|uniref:Uncharacterized protein n=1 Tax=Araneus ventricosus TaxID=182803 RepID=A0A4Y2FRB8_ARAVE|nr:hypothetical protein AVEN_167802-1 [Araneus ventricosus]
MIKWKNSLEKAGSLQAKCRFQSVDANRLLTKSHLNGEMLRSSRNNKMRPLQGGTKHLVSLSCRRKTSEQLLSSLCTKPFPLQYCDIGIGLKDDIRCCKDARKSLVDKVLLTLKKSPGKAMGVPYTISATEQFSGFFTDARIPNKIEGNTKVRLSVT